MVMPSSGPLNMGGTTTPRSVAAELGLGLTTTISMNQANVRTLAGVGGSGTSWSMSSLYGKSNRVAISFTYSANTTNAALNVTTISGYVAGKSDITVNINSGVYVYSTSTGTPGLTLTGGASGDTLRIVNSGFILGMGGKGGDMTIVWDGRTGSLASSTAQVGAAGGTALSLGFPTTITNTGYIAGGGGGGGAAYAVIGLVGSMGAGGGGAGAGAGGSAIRTGVSGAPSNTRVGGTGGGPGAAGTAGQSGVYTGDPAQYTNTGSAGGGAGRIPSNANVSNTANATRFSRGGGTNATGASSQSGTYVNYYVGGPGAGAGAPGGLMVHIQSGKLDFTYAAGGGGGGGFGASGSAGLFTDTAGSGGTTSAGGAGGKAIALNGYTVTWPGGVTGNVYGSVS